jgi:hypothetical protein
LFVAALEVDGTASSSVGAIIGLGSSVLKSINSTTGWSVGIKKEEKNEKVGKLFCWLSSLEAKNF